MSDTVYFGSFVVEHEDWSTSYVYKDGFLVKTFSGREDSWMNAERWAQDQHFASIYN